MCCTKPQDQRCLRHRDFCKRILPATPPIIDVETMNEFHVRCHHLWQRRWRITAASLVDTTGLSWNLLPLLPPYLYAHLAMKPCNRSCEMLLAGKIRRAASRSAWPSPRWEFESCICSRGGTWLRGRAPVNGLRVTPDLFLRYVVWTKTICCCIADACAYRTLTAMARVPVRAAWSRHDCCQGSRVRWKRSMVCIALGSEFCLVLK